MAAHHMTIEHGLWDPHAPLDVEPLPRDLTHSGHKYLERIALSIDEVAPKPGLLVYVAATKLALPLNGLDFVLFSAIDVSTHLQVAQAYHSLTTASAVTFVDFVAECFPFPISQIRTLAERPFYNGTEQASQRDFSVLIGRKGYIHSPVMEASRDALFSLSSKLHFKGLAGGFVAHTSSHDLQREIGQFLFFHNNYRTIPWLDGKTPLQRLRAFEGYRHVHSLNVFEEQETVPLHPNNHQDTIHRRAREVARS
jgi:hypothetical protein